MRAKGEQRRAQPGKRILRQLLTGSLGMAVAIVATLTVAAVIGGRMFLQENLRKEQLQLAQRTMNAVDQTLYEQYRQVQLIAGQAGLGTVLGLKKLPAAHTSAQNARLSELADISGHWETLRVLRLDGTVAYSADEAKTEGPNPHNREYQSVFETGRSGQPAYSDAFIEPVSQRWTMLFAAPVRDTGGLDRPVTGVVVGSLSWQTVQEMLQSDAGHIVQLFNRHGARIGQASPISATDKILVSTASQQGYKDFKGQGWTVAVATPAAAVFSSMNQLAVILPALGGVVILALLPFLLRSYYQNFLMPVRLLIKSANGVTNGGLLTSRVSVKTSNEIGELGSAFNEMADKLQDVYRSLEKATSERTTELAQKVDEIESEKAKDEAILGSIGEAMIATDSTMRVLVTNRVAAELLEFDAVTAHNRWLSEVVLLKTPDGQPVPLEQLPSFTALKTAERHRAEFRYDRHDGRQIVVSVTANPIIQNGRTTGAIMILRDVTRDREVDRMKTEFISLASHQLRTPLSAIKWFSEMLLAGDAGKLKPEQREFTQNIAESTERMIELVDSLLNISRIESGRIIIEPEPTDLRELLDGIVGELSARVEAKQQKLTVKIEKGLPKVNLDQGLVSQVYANLLTNAIKYTPDGGRISVVIKAEDGQVVSQVKDSGYGIPKAAQEHLFQKFFRADNAVKIETDGTGLGLYLVKAIVDSSGGKIWFESHEGQGTSFWFTVPLEGMKRKDGEVMLNDEIIF